MALVSLALLMAGCARIGKPTGWASPALDEALYVTLERGHLSALDPESFEVQWEFPASDEFSCGGGSQEKYDLEGIYEAPAFDDDTLYFGAYDGAVYAIDREQATCKWRFETDDPIVGGLVLTDEGLYVPSEDGFLYLLNAEDGSEITKRALGDIWATPLVTKDGAVYVATIEGELWKLERETLEPLWDLPFSKDAALLTPPTLSPQGGILVGGIGKNLYLVSEDDGSEVWQASGKNWFWGPPVGDGDVIYATNLGKQVLALNAEDGSEKWSFETQASVRAGVVLVGDTVVAVDESGVVYRLDAESGDLLGQPNELEQTVHATPLLIGGNPTSGSITATPTDNVEGREVLISTKDGTLWLLDVAQGRTSEVVD